MENPQAFKNFDVSSDGLVHLKLDDWNVLCIPAVKIDDRNLQEVVISEAHSLLAHLSPWKILAYLREQVWWKDMSKDIYSFCESCTTCKRSKPSNQKPYGLLNPLSVLTQPWEAIGINFIILLPLSKDRNSAYNSITVAIYLLIMMVHLILSHTNYTAQQVAELVFLEVYKHHGLPRAIISDRDSLFTSLFWSHLHKLVGSQLKMSSAYHPKTDGSTEQANQMIVQMIWQCIGLTQQDWITKLPVIEFAINSSQSKSTGYAPFFLNHGGMPRSMIWNSAKASEFPGVHVFSQRLKLAIMAAHDSVLAACIKQTHVTN